MANLLPLLFNLMLIHIGGGFSYKRNLISHLPVATDDMFSWTGEHGTYRFGMQGKDQWRVERKYPDGRVYIRYAYKTPDGKVTDIAYTVGDNRRFRTYIRDAQARETKPTKKKVSNQKQNIEKQEKLKQKDTVSTKVRENEEKEPDVLMKEIKQEDDMFDLDTQPRKLVAKSYGALKKSRTNENIENDLNEIVDIDTNSIVIEI